MQNAELKDKDGEKVSRFRGVKESRGKDFENVELKMQNG